MGSTGSNSTSVAMAYLEPDACRAVHMPLHCRKQAGQLEHQHLHHTHTDIEHATAASDHVQRSPEEAVWGTMNASTRMSGQ